MWRRLGTEMLLVVMMSLPVSTVQAGISFADPPGGWTYIYTGDQCATQFDACLDGKWNHYDAGSGGSDAWDGAAPGKVITQGVKPAPGGAGVFKEGNVSFLRIQDPGDPTSTTGGGWADPSNRKLTFLHDITKEVAKATTILDDGVTLTFRTRIPTTPPLDPLYLPSSAPKPWVTAGYNIHDDGYGVFGLKQGTGGSGVISFSLAMDTDEGTISGDGLTMNKKNGTAVTADVDSYDSAGTENTLTGFDPTQWHEFWIQIVRDTSGGGTHKVTIWMDGDVTNSRTFAVTAGNKNQAPATWNGYLLMSLGRSSIAGAQDIDFFGYKAGLYTPVSLRSPAVAVAPSPADKISGVPATPVLSWTAGAYASKHDVYLGTDPNAVGKASVTNPLGVLVSHGQSGTTYSPAQPLAYGKTYYWRVDEINAPPTATVYQGSVWSFTVEPFSVVLKSITATASSSAQADTGPEKTIDGSGLNASGQHSTNTQDMWLSNGTLPNWIQYAFDKPYMLDELLVWNSNQMVENILGLGAKNVKVECSTDGSTWTTVAGVSDFARATGQATYTANTTVNLGGVVAKYVKLTINSTWGGLPQTGLSEVQFFYVPVQASAPMPSPGATGVDLDATLSWRPGHVATSHKVLLGTDKDAVAKGTAPVYIATGPSYQPASLLFGTTYYWKVNEVNDAATPSTWEGDVWSFTTKEYAVVDDFESYNDDNNRIYDTWIDGLSNNNGSIVGYMQAPFAEQTLVHGGKQSMPIEYNNIKTPYYSEAERTWAKAQDWTGNGADTLVLYFQGRSVAFLEKSPGDIVMGGGGADIFGTADQFRFAFKSLTGNGTIVARVESIVATDPWAKAGVMIRESLAAGSRYAFVLASPGNGVRFQARAMTDSGATSDTGVATPDQMALKVPVWVKVERIGTTFNGYYSADGVKWTTMSWDPQTINMVANPVYIGLAVTSHNAALQTTAEFSNVATTGNVTGSWNSQAIGLAQPSNTPGQLYVMVQDSAGKSKVVNHPDPAATTTSGWQEWRIPLGDFTSAGVKMSSVKKLVIGVGDRAGPKTDGAGMLFIDDIGFGHPASTK